MAILEGNKNQCTKKNKVSDFWNEGVDGFSKLVQCWHMVTMPKLLHCYIVMQPWAIVSLPKVDLLVAQAYADLLWVVLVSTSSSMDDSPLKEMAQ